MSRIHHARLSEISEAAIRASDSRDHLEWAKKPVSHYAVRAVIDGAKKGGVLKDVLEGLIADGIVDSSGRAVKLWDRSTKQFVPVAGRAM